MLRAVGTRLPTALFIYKESCYIPLIASGVRKAQVG